MRRPSLVLKLPNLPRSLIPTVSNKWHLWPISRSSFGGLPQHKLQLLLETKKNEATPNEKIDQKKMKQMSFQMSISSLKLSGYHLYHPFCQATIYDHNRGMPAASPSKPAPNNLANTALHSRNWSILKQLCYDYDMNSYIYIYVCVLIHYVQNLPHVQPIAAILNVSCSCAISKVCPKTLTDSTKPCQKACCTCQRKNHCTQRILRKTAKDPPCTT